MGRGVVKPPWAIELDDETSRGELKSGERVGVGEDGLEVGKHLGHRGMAGRRGRLRGRVPAQQEGADVTLAEEESAPESLPGAAAEPTAGVTGGVGQAVDDGALEETPQPPGGRTHASDGVGEPNADGAPATGACAAVRAKNPPGPDGFFAGRRRHRNRADSHDERACRPPGNADTPSTSVAERSRSSRRRCGKTSVDRPCSDPAPENRDCSAAEERGVEAG